MKEVLLLIPAHNEEESIGAFLEQLMLAKVDELADILVINDYSTDHTVQVAQEHGVHVIDSMYNIGYGSALQMGYKYAVERNYRYVIQLDADGQHDACNVHNLYEKLTNPGADGHVPDIVIGSRFADGSKSFYINRLKKISIAFFRLVIRLTTGQTILDPTSGLQGLDRRAFKYYSEFQNFDTMYPDANMVIQMLMLGYRVEEIPSIMHERHAGTSMHSGILKPLIYMMVMPLSILAIYVRIKRNFSKKAHHKHVEGEAHV